MNVMKLESTVFKRETEEAERSYKTRAVHDADVAKATGNGEGPAIFDDTLQPLTRSPFSVRSALARSQAARAATSGANHVARRFHEAVKAEELRRAG